MSKKSLPMKLKISETKNVHKFWYSCGKLRRNSPKCAGAISGAEVGPGTGADSGAGVRSGSRVGSSTGVVSGAGTSSDAGGSSGTGITSGAGTCSDTGVRLDDRISSYDGNEGKCPNLKIATGNTHNAMVNTVAIICFRIFCLFFSS